MWHADDVNVRFTSGRLDETQQSDIVGQRQIVELRMDHDVRNVQLLVGQLFGGDADVVFTETDFQNGADVAASQTADTKAMYCGLLHSFARTHARQRAEYTIAVYNSQYLTKGGEKK